ncbi:MULTISPECIES: murein hydrolase activator EnvC [Reichenbachiella]|uniref:Septal ring factor EnvC, activator of murein hydrolases AmiA and AmiB n=1 Tax=Reichenbachiella agariperforans TaxID=156994 RepID=A0A1M6NJ56_REIAG|nr:MULTISPECIES: peptidoglycan DD-metalloendopeptidase family protein [Reichenbachiella]RJE71846.1 peptidase M23 [Reichenbachiella sp. MSK19-1]SHJ95727.1 Septal ring factor EnvC, activator of murein hydrolases AmiA and AmiB [Reichenbachiella agariperforans]
MHLKTKLLLLCVFALLSTSLLAQKSKAQLEKEKKENLKKINETEKILKETASEKNSSLGQLKAINHQIDIQQDVMSTINQEISMLNGEISDLSIVTNALESDLAQLKKEYADMIYSAYKANQGYSQLTFLFSASTFNQLFLRLKYLEQYAKARQRQVTQIEKVRDALNGQKSNLVSKKEEQGELLNSKIAENRNLINLKSKQNQIVQDLSKREKELKRELASRKRSIEQLDNLLADIIKKEIAASNKGKNTSANTISLSAEGAVLSASFEDNKNKLPWPVASGFVSEKFGKHAHPVLKNITVENQGVDIQTQKDANVQAVFSGKVATTAFVPGMNSVVIIQHGDYYTLYAKLKTVNVKKGQVITAKQSIGSVFTNKDGITELQFQVWKNNVKLDPEKWLFKK